MQETNQSSSKPTQSPVSNLLKLPIISKIESDPLALDSESFHLPTHKAIGKILTYKNSDTISKQAANSIITSSGGIHLPIKPSKFVLNSKRQQDPTKKHSIDSDAQSSE